MRTYDCILFDWDGTIAKTLDIWHEALKVALKAQGIELSSAKVGANFSELASYLEQQGYNNADEIIQHASRVSEQNIPLVELYAGSVRLLKFLKKHGKRIALVTTSAHKQIDALLEKNNLTHIFDVVVCGDDVEQVKPNPEPLLKAVALLGADAKHTLMVGDSSADIVAAKAANIDVALFYPEGHHNLFYDLDELRKLSPEYVCNNLADLERII